MADSWSNDEKKDFGKGVSEDSGWNPKGWYENAKNAFKPSKVPAGPSPSPSPDRRKLSEKIYESSQ